MVSVPGGYQFHPYDDDDAGDDCGGDEYIIFSHSWLIQKYLTVILMAMMT